MMIKWSTGTAGASAAIRDFGNSKQYQKKWEKQETQQCPVLLYALKNIQKN